MERHMISPDLWTSRACATLFTKKGEISGRLDSVPEYHPYNTCLRLAIHLQSGPRRCIRPRIVFPRSSYPQYGSPSSTQSPPHSRELISDENGVPRPRKLANASRRALRGKRPVRRMRICKCSSGDFLHVWERRGWGNSVYMTVIARGYQG